MSEYDCQYGIACVNYICQEEGQKSGEVHWDGDDCLKGLICDSSICQENGIPESGNVYCDEDYSSCPEGFICDGYMCQVS